jgi:hypothetical protein
MAEFFSRARGLKKGSPEQDGMSAVLVKYEVLNYWKQAEGWSAPDIKRMHRRKTKQIGPQKE